MKSVMCLCRVYLCATRFHELRKPCFCFDAHYMRDEVKASLGFHIVRKNHR